MGASQSRSSTQANIPGWEKVNGIQLPGQSGKTRKMEEKIAEYMAFTRNDNDDDDLNILISSNSKLLVEQTTTRFDNDLGPQCADDSESSDSTSSSDDGAEIVVLKNGASTWTSSVKKEPMELFADILDDEVSMIVCCANTARFKKLIMILERLEKSKHFKRKINIWIDEAHKPLTLLLKEQNNRIIAFKKIARVTLVTASWDPIDKYFAIPRIPYEVTHPDVYRSLHECEWRIIEPLMPDDDDDAGEETCHFDMSTQAPGYIQQIFNDAHLLAFIEQPGKKWLIPGNSRTITHDAIAEYLVNRGWNGLKLNGKEKALRIHVGDRVIDYTTYNNLKQEPKDVLARLFHEYPELSDAPFFVTGLNCIKEGITFQGENFMFNGAILPNITSPSDAYQLACRLAGNLKGLDIYTSYARPLVITTSRMERKIKKQENIAIFLPRILYESGRTLPTSSDKNRAARGYVRHDAKGMGYRVFKHYSTFLGYTGLLGRRTLFREAQNTSLGDPFYPFHTASIQSSRGATSKPRYLTEAIDKIDLAYGGGGALKTGFPCYLDINDSTTLVWVAVVPDIPDIMRLTDHADSIYPDESSAWMPFAKDYTLD